VSFVRRKKEVERQKAPLPMATKEPFLIIAGIIFISVEAGSNFFAVVVIVTFIIDYYPHDHPLSSPS
jgi:hypothetical protein